MIVSVGPATAAVTPEGIVYARGKAIVQGRVVDKEVTDRKGNKSMVPALSGPVAIASLDGEAPCSLIVADSIPTARKASQSPLRAIAAAPASGVDDSIPWRTRIVITGRDSSWFVPPTKAATRRGPLAVRSRGLPPAAQATFS